MKHYFKIEEHEPLSTITLYKNNQFLFCFLRKHSFSLSHSLNIKNIVVDFMGIGALTRTQSKICI